MSEDSSELSRRKFLEKTVKLTGAGAMLLLTGGACDHPQNRREPEQRQRPDSKETPDTRRYFEMIEAGRRRKTAEDIRILNETMPGIDLTYYGNQTLADIRQIRDKTQRIMEMIGYLDVEQSGRYSWPAPEYSGREPWYCNVYAFDFVRGLIGNDDIGYRKNIASGEPFSVGPNNLDWTIQAEIDKLDDEYVALSSNEMDAWMRDHGSVRHRWERVDDQETLYQELSGGAIAIGVIKDEIIQEAIQRDENFTGHAFVLGAGDNNFFLTQSTTNIALKVLPKDSTDIKVKPEDGDYHFWVHKLPD
ncbi:hypothetical protein ACFL25_00710 [Patescibacteria group bacterium]